MIGDPLKCSATREPCWEAKPAKSNIRSIVFSLDGTLSDVADNAVFEASSSRVLLFGLTSPHHTSRHSLIDFSNLQPANHQTILNNFRYKCNRSRSKSNIQNNANLKHDENTIIEIKINIHQSYRHLE